MVIEILFIIDICINFFVEYKEEDTDTMVQDTWKTAKMYLQTYFLFDLAATFPFALLFATVEQSNGSQLIRLVYLLKLFRVRKIIVLARPEVYKNYVNNFYKRRLEIVIERAANNTINLDP